MGGWHRRMAPGHGTWALPACRRVGVGPGGPCRTRLQSARMDGLQPAPPPSSPAARPWGAGPLPAALPELSTRLFPELTGSQEVTDLFLKQRKNLCSPALTPVLCTPAHTFGDNKKALQCLFCSHL